MKKRGAVFGVILAFALILAACTDRFHGVVIGSGANTTLVPGSALGNGGAVSTADFTIIALPDTQYYAAAYPWAFTDQMQWIVDHRADKNIQVVIGLGDIVDGGGPNPSGACYNAPASNWQTQWQRASGAYGILDGAGIPYMATIGNHDYDCEADRPQPRSTSNFDTYFGPSRYAGRSWFRGGRMSPSSSANFYNYVNINGEDWMFLALEFFPRNSVLAWADSLISANASKKVIVATHAYMYYDGSGPGTGHPITSGDSDSAASYKLSPSCPESGSTTCGNGNNGSDVWTKLISRHSNIVGVLSGHIRLPNPEDVVAVAPLNNGVGRVDCGVQPGSYTCALSFKPFQILSDYQGQGGHGYFGNGYLRIMTFHPSTRRIDISTYSPPIERHPQNFPQPPPPVAKTDSYNQFSISY